MCILFVWFRRRLLMVYCFRSHDYFVKRAPAILIRAYDGIFSQIPHSIACDDDNDCEICIYSLINRTRKNPTILKLISSDLLRNPMQCIGYTHTHAHTLLYVLCLCACMPFTCTVKNTQGNSLLLTLEHAIPYRFISHQFNCACVYICVMHATLRIWCNVFSCRG